ncbi:MAG: ArnT family glycosyltransferase [Syntrophobacteraceae bacterium]
MRFINFSGYEWPNAFRKSFGPHGGDFSDKMMALWERRPLLWVSLAALPVFLLGLWTPGMDQSEAMYAEIAREMRTGADWITPHLNGARHFDKPPLLYWLIAIAQSVLGESELSARLFPALAAWGTIPVTGAIGTALFGRRAGWAAALVQTTSLGPFIFGRMILPDPSLSFWISLAILGYVKGFVQENNGLRSPWPWVMFAAAGFASLIKGLLGLGLPAVIVGIHAIVSQRLRSLFSLRLLLWAGLTAAVAVPWYWAVCRANPEFFDYFFIREHFQRYTGQRFPADEFVSLPLFLTLTLMWTFPWAAVVPAALWQGVKRAFDTGWRRAPEMLPLLWVGIVVGLFATSKSRLEYYAFPALPAASLLVGRFWSHLLDNGQTLPLPRSAVYSVGSMATLACLAATGSYLLLGPASGLIFEAVASTWPGSGWVGGSEQTATLDRIWLPTVATLAWIALISSRAMLCLKKTRYGAALALLGAMTIPLFIMVHWGFRVMEPFMSLRPTARLAAHHAGPSGAIVSREPHEYMWIGGLPYYSGRMVYVLKDPRYDQAPPNRREPPERFLDGQALATLWSSAGRVVMVVDKTDPILPELRSTGRYDLIAEVGGKAVVGN